jgi:hypothetical protein
MEERKSEEERKNKGRRGKTEASRKEKLKIMALYTDHGFWVVAPFCDVVSEESDEGNRFPRNVGNHLPDYTVS